MRYSYDRTAGKMDTETIFKKLSQASGILEDVRSALALVGHGRTMDRPMETAHREAYGAVTEATKGVEAAVGSLMPYRYK